MLNGHVIFSWLQQSMKYVLLDAIIKDHYTEINMQYIVFYERDCRIFGDFTGQHKFENKNA